MYRARVDSVNGTKVYAGGKWLSCIGNKPVRVGDYIWTDGRCVYGNNQVPQQPLVITAPDNEGIPIAITGSDNSIEMYSFVHGRLQHVGTFPKSESGIKYSCMVNDKKRNAFISSGDLATNIDDEGNFFTLSMTSNESWQDSICINKNFECVKIINLSDLYQTILDDIPDPPHMNDPGWDGDSLYPGHDYWNAINVEVYGSPFIENESDWHFFIVLEGTKGAFTYEGNSAGYTIYDNIVDFDVVVCVKPDGINFLKNTIIQAVAQYGSETATIISSDEKHCDPIKLSLGDGFYRIATFIPPDPNAYGVQYGGTYNCEYFSPNDEKLFESTDILRTVCRIAKVKSGYLIYSMLNFFNELEGFDNRAGFYLLSDNKLEYLMYGNCINQRLRPIKKIKGWQNRLKEV